MAMGCGRQESGGTKALILKTLFGGECAPKKYDDGAAFTSFNRFYAEKWRLRSSLNRFAIPAMDKVRRDFVILGELLLPYEFSCPAYP
jgi:hypothetical protein